MFCLVIPLGMYAQNYISRPDTINKGRLLTLGIGGAATYVGGMYLLYNAWYRHNAMESFHFFDDSREWLQVDKAGHIYSAYNDSRLAYEALRWTGMRTGKAQWLGFGTGMLIQSSIEVFDGFSSKWGFSWSDMGANVLGSGAFLAQEALWKEQRIQFKVSSDFRSYPRTLFTATDDPGLHDDLQRRAQDLFGTSYAAGLLKDYNAQTNWMCITPAAFLEQRPAWLPAWLGVAVGYSAENMYGGFNNEWSFQDGQYSLDPQAYPRYRQFLLSPDIDFTRIPTRSPWLKAIFYGLNLIKLPAPTLEFNTRGQVNWHWIYF